MIQFGTSGWRAVIAEEFTYDNVRRVVHAICQHLVPLMTTDKLPEKSSMSRVCQLSSTAPVVVVGYDTRFLSPELAKMAADIVASYGYHILLSKDPVPTPVVSFQVIHHKA